MHNIIIKGHLMILTKSTEYLSHLLIADHSVPS